jgi:hypothetical protein
MDFRRSMLRVLACTAAGLLASCIDGREEIWLHADGSGRAEVSYSLPAAAAKLQGGDTGVQRMIEGFLKDTPAISTSNCEVTTVGDRMHIRVQTTFDSALELKDISMGAALNKLPSSATGLTGDFKVDVRGLTVDFSRTIKAGEALPGAGFMPVSRFKDRQLTYIIHLPEAATDSNATRIEDSGRTLVWDFPLAVAIQGPVVTRFTAPVPLPRWAAATGWVSAALVVLLAGRKLFRRKASAV